MVWINTRCSNRVATEGAFGGSLCICPKCTAERQQKARLTKRYKHRPNHADDEGIIAAAQDIDESL